jgi:hypothetical protein
MGTSPHDDGDREADPASRPAGLWILIVAAVVLVLAIVIAAIVGAKRDAPVYEEGSPQAALQGYLDAVIDGDATEAYGYLSDDLRSECTLSDLRNAAAEAQDVTVTLRTVRDEDGTVRIDVTIEQNGGGLLLGGGYRYDETFILGDTNGVWKLSERPWPIYFCSEER